MPAGGDEPAVDGQEEAEAEKGDDDEVDETDCDCWDGNGRTEGAEIKH